MVMPLPLHRPLPRGSRKSEISAAPQEHLRLWTVAPALWRFDFTLNQELSPNALKYLISGKAR
jgi:hypothetical protein